MAVKMHIYSAATFFLKFELLRNSFCAFELRAASFDVFLDAPKKVAAERHLPQLFLLLRCRNFFFLAKFFIAYIVGYRVDITPIQVGNSQLHEMKSG
jgi:hypothetical protein